MIRSMTAFARQERLSPVGTITVELRSVNHRFLEVSMRMPEELRAMETALRGRISATANRGKVDCSIRFQPAGAPAELAINQELAKTLARVSRELDALLYDPAPISAVDLMKWPGVLQTGGPAPEALEAEVMAALDDALLELTQTREREGQALKAVMEQRLDQMVERLPVVRERLPQIIQRSRERLTERLAELKGELDPARLEQEIVLFAQKIDVDEELDRLETHITEVRRVLGQNQPVGRRLDFLMQELNREANTLGSKSADSETTRVAVDLKVLIEQMREQVQNIE